MIKTFIPLIGRVLTAVVLGLTWLTPATATAVAAGEGGLLQARVETPAFTLAANGVAVDGYALNTAPGAPMLPVHGLTFELPPSGEWTLRFESTGSRILAERVPVAAVPVPDLDLNSPIAPQDREEWPTAVPVVDRPDPAIYGVDAFYPASPVIAGEPVLQGGRRILPVRVFPFQFNPVTQELRYHPDLLITVQTERATEAVLPAGPPPGDFYQPLTLPGDGVLRIHTQDRGLYRLTYADLSAQGVPVGPGGVNPATFAIYYKGQQIAIEVQDGGDGAFDDGDLVIFYAVPYDSGLRFQNFNIYQFVWGNGVPSPQRIAVRPVSATTVPTATSWISQTLHVEFNRDYRSLYPRPDYADHFFDTQLYPNTTTPTVTRSYDLALSHPVTTGGVNVQIRALIHGGVNQAANPDQSVLLRLNSYDLGVYQWEGRVDNLITASAPAAWLDGAPNRVHLVAALSQLPALSYYWISPDWVQVSYPAQAIAANDRLYIEGLVAPTDAVAVSGFSTPFTAIFDVSDESSPQRLSGAGVQADQSGYLLHWDEAEAGRSYALSSTAALLAPGAIERINRSGRPAAWANPSHTYDYIAIVGAQRNYNGTTTLGDQLAAAVQPLLTYRASSAGGGFNVAVVPVQDIYDEWSYGRLDPLAIRSFLSYAYFNWQTPPGYVLLVGDGHYDFNKVMSNQLLPMLLPPYLSNVDPWWGEVPTDNLYVSVDSLADFLPDIAVGRLPAINADNVTAVVNKILTYEDPALNPPGLWQQRAVYVADDCTDSAGNFHALSNQARLQELPTAYTNRIVYFDNPNIATVCPEGNQSTSVGMRTAIRSEFNAGALFLQWFGHGSQTRWGGAVSMFQANDFPSYGARTQLPLTMANACLTGYFVHTSQTLSEQMVNTASRVSIADLSPSGLHVGNALLTLQKGMHKKLFHERIERAGDVVDAAKWYFFENSFYYLDVIDTMIFFGDPALKLRYPTGDLSTSSLEVSDAVAPLGATLGYTLTIDNSSIYTASLPSAVVDYPQGVVTVLSANGAVDNGDTLTWTLPNLSPASQQVVTFTLQVDAAPPPEGFNLLVPATVSSQMAPAVALAAETLILTAPDAVTSSLAGSRAWLPPSFPLTATLTISHEGDLPAVGVQVAITLPAGLSAPAWLSTPAMVYDPVAHGITWQGDAPAGSPTALAFGSVISPTLTGCSQLAVAALVSYNQASTPQSLLVNLVTPDVDCSGSVTVADIQQVAARWGAQAGDSLYHPRYDLNADDVIDVLDITAAAQVWN